MGGGLPIPAQSLEAVDCVSKGDRKDSRKGTGPEINVKGGGTVCAIIWQRDMGGEQGDAQVPDRVPLSGGVIDHRVTEKFGAGGWWEYPSTGYKLSLVVL